MSIEFTCSSCGQQLRVSDDAAGKRAKCPKCSQINFIPTPAPETESDPDELRMAPEEPRYDRSDSPFSQSPPNPYSAPQTGAGPAGIAATSSPFAGGKICNVPTDIGSILNYAFAVWQQNLGLLVGATVVVGVISVGISWGISGAAAVLQHLRQDELALVLNVLGYAVSWMVQTFLGIGMTQLTLKLARQQPVEFGELFSGGPRFLPVLGVSILFGLAVAGGFIMLIIPGIIVLLMWWPCYYLVVEDKATVTESFGVARSITEYNMGTTFLCWIVGFGISMLGCCACYVGLLFAAPLVNMMMTTAYLMMSGQLPLQPSTATGKQLA